MTEQSKKKNKKHRLYKLGGSLGVLLGKKQLASIGIDKNKSAGGNVMITTTKDGLLIQNSDVALQ